MQMTPAADDAFGADGGFNPFQDFLAAGGFDAEVPLPPTPAPAPTAVRPPIAAAPAVPPATQAVPTAARAAPPTSTSDDLFGGTAFGAPTSKAAQTTPPAASDDLFGGTAFGAAPPKPPQPAPTPAAAAAAPAWDAWGLPAQAAPASQGMASPQPPTASVNNPWGPTAFGAPATSQPAGPVPTSAVGGFGERKAAMQAFPQADASLFAQEFEDPAFAVTSAAPKPVTPPPGRPMRPKSSASTPSQVPPMQASGPPVQASGPPTQGFGAPTANGAAPFALLPTQVPPTQTAGADPWAAAFGMAPTAAVGGPPQQMGAPPQAAPFPTDAWAAFPEAGNASTATSSAAGGTGPFDMFGGGGQNTQAPTQQPASAVYANNTADDDFWASMGSPSSAKPTVQIPSQAANTAPASSLKLGSVMTEGDRQKCEGAWQAKVHNFLPFLSNSTIETILHQ